MSKKRRSKTLEKAARAVKDSDEFVEHIFSIARGFAAHHELDTGAGVRGVRRSLKTFEKHATALTEWLNASAKRGTPEAEALANIVAASRALGIAYVDPSATSIWLTNTARAANRAEAELQGKKLKNAPASPPKHCARRSSITSSRCRIKHQRKSKAMP